MKCVSEDCKGCINCDIDVRTKAKRLCRIHRMIYYGECSTCIIADLRDILIELLEVRTERLRHVLGTSVQIESIPPLENIEDPKIGIVEQPG